MNAPKTGFRPDIEGLRAVAVLAVVLFHAGLPGVGGGLHRRGCVLCHLGLLDHRDAGARGQLQLDGLKRHGELAFGRDRCSPVVLDELLAMSAATIDR